MQDFTFRFANWQEDQDLLMAVRLEVFVEEQKVDPNIEKDNLDPLCLHILALASDNKPVATARMSTEGRIGRCAVLKPWRRRGLGLLLLSSLIEKAKELELSELVLNSQLHAVPFYQKLGFQICGANFIEANIIHVPMLLKLS